MNALQKLREKVQARLGDLGKQWKDSSYECRKTIEAREYELKDVLELVKELEKEEVANSCDGR